MTQYKEVMQSFEFNSLLKAFWNYDGATPEESETLKACRLVIQLKRLL